MADETPLEETPRWSAKGRRMRGFEATSGLLKDRIRAAGESRGFAVTRLLTHWPDVVGADLARVTRPVKVGYAKGAFGATLTLLVKPTDAPIVQMQLPRIKDRVNACYGYAAIGRVTLTQTAPMGFAEGQAQFGPAPTPPEKPAPSPEIAALARETAGDVHDEGLRKALETLAQNILTRRRT
ncbi:DUF721 domain-containing protein [Gemmobacter serpentinus]|uniref:DUF721 domain-containing protein n=1 Tax=Gemmobacter serpentinus TaxID=2652247 RepID=UPI001CF71D01|nr:DUF721 domain-containing protein [Gemmobacter serpentinus]